MKMTTTQRLLDLFEENLGVINRLLVLLGYEDKRSSTPEAGAFLPKTQKNQLIASLVDQFK